MGLPLADVGERHDAPSCLALLFDPLQANVSWRTYRLAGQTVACDVEVPVLAAFTQPCEEGLVLPELPCRSATASEHSNLPPATQGEVAISSASTPPAGDQPGRQRLHRGLGWIAREWRHVECWRDASGYHIAVQGIGAFRVDSGGRWGCRLPRANEAIAHDRDALTEAMLVPVLILALALRGIWCLHAAAVTLADRAIAFVGSSGSGKSSLAAHLAHEPGSPFRHLADDILPVALGPGGVDAWPRFPQLKWPPNAQPGAGAPERLPLAAVYCLAPPPVPASEVSMREPAVSRAASPGLAEPPERAGQDSAQITIRPLVASDAALALVRHSVAARLFGEELLTGQLVFCARAAERMPVRELRYPRSWEALPRVSRLVLADLQAGVTPPSEG